MTVDLDALADRIALPDEAARAHARESVGGGRLGDLAVWLAGVQGRPDPRPPRSARLVVVAGDRAPGTAAPDVAALLAGEGVVPATAADLDVAVRVVDAGLASTPDPAVERVVPVSGAPLGPGPVCTSADAEAGFAAGAALADRLADEGCDLLVLTHLGSGAGAAAAALGVLLADLDVTEAVDRAAGDAAWVRDVPAVRDATRRAKSMLGDKVALLAEVGGADLAVVGGLLLGAAARQTPVVLDGTPVLATAMLTHRLAYRGVLWWLAADSGVTPVGVAALDRLGLEPVADLRVAGQPGLAGLLAVPLLRAASAL